MKPDRKERRKATLKKWKAMTSEERAAFNRQLAEDIHSDCAAWDDCVNEHMSGIMAHYANARKKHPYFCDEVIPGKGYKPEDRKIVAASCLYVERQRIKAGARDGNILWKELLDCEVWEAIEALVNGNTVHAVDECYDAIAVLLRTIDVLEGRQKLGKPQTISGNDAGR